MGNLRAALFARAPLAGLASLVSLAACGGGGGDGTPDAPVAPDAAPDAPPADGPVTPSYDFGCFGRPFPATAPQAITAAGVVRELTQQGPAAVGGATIATFEVGTADAIDTVTGTDDGSFTTGSLATGGVPFDGYLRTTKADDMNPFRATFVFPPAPFAADALGVPVVMFREAIFDAIATVIAGVDQDDDANGALMVLVTDCENNPIAGAPPTVKQGGAVVGTVFALSMLNPMAAGIYLVYNVPPGETEVSASYMNMAFPPHRVISFKNGGAIEHGATTLTIARPGPL